MSIKANLTKKYAQSQDVVARTIQNELLIIPLSSDIVDEDSGIFSLNQTGQAVWKKMNGKRNLKEISVLLSDEYGEPARKIEKDIMALVNDLLRRKIIVPVA